MSMISYSSIGNTLHIVNLLNIALYALLLYLFGGRGDSTVFDPEWLTAGFCLPHGDDPFRTTHDLSGYVMVAIALAGIGIQQFLLLHASQLTEKGAAAAGSNRDSGGTTVPGNQKGSHLAQANALAFWAMVGALGHASGHFLIAHAIRGGYYPPPEERFIDDLMRSTVPEAIMKAGPSYPLFWIPLVKTYMINTSKRRVAAFSFVIFVGVTFMPVKFGFSYTQAVLFAGMSIDQLMLRKEEKGFEYALWPLITTIPNGIFSWVESVACTSSFVMQQHGHLVYDVYMASSYIVFYLICWLRIRYAVKSKVL